MSVVDELAEIDLSLGRPTDRVTIAQAPSPLSFRKVYQGGKGLDYQHVRWVRPHVREVCSVWGLAALLERVSTRPDCCVLGGDPVEGPGEWRRRHYHRNLPSDDIAAGELGFSRHPEGKRWVMLDIDKVVPPEGFPEAPSAEDLLAWVGGYLPQHVLPEGFRGVSGYYRWSASAGVRPWRDGISCHLWYWLSRPVDGRSLSQWLRREAPAVDTITVKSFVQPHYVSPPLVLDGPVLTHPRSGLVRGELGRDQVDLPEEVVDTPTWRERVAEDEERVEAARQRYATQRELRPTSGIRAEVRRALAALQGACRDIVGAGEGQRHAALAAAAYRFGRKVAAGELDEHVVISELVLAGESCLPSKRHAEVRRTVSQCVANGMTSPRATG